MSTNKHDDLDAKLARLEQLVKRIEESQAQNRKEIMHLRVKINGLVTKMANGTQCENLS